MQQASESSSRAQYNNSQVEQRIQHSKSPLQIDTQDPIGPPTPPETSPQTPTFARRQPVCPTDLSTLSVVQCCQKPGVEVPQLGLNQTQSRDAVPQVQTARLSQLHAEPPANHRQSRSSRKSMFLGELMFLLFVVLSRVFVRRHHCQAFTTNQVQLFSSSRNGSPKATQLVNDSNKYSGAHLHSVDSIIITRRPCAIFTPVLAQASKAYITEFSRNAPKTPLLHKDVESMNPSEFRQVLRNQIVQRLSTAQLPQNNTTFKPFYRKHQSSLSKRVPPVRPTKSKQSSSWESGFQKLPAVGRNSRKSVWVTQINASTASTVERVSYSERTLDSLYTYDDHDEHDLPEGYMTNL